MKKLFGLVAAFVLITSCEKDELSVADNFYGDWRVLYLNPAGLFKNNVYPDDSSPRITFNPDGSLLLRLSANSCGGDYVISDVNKLNVAMIYCTEICCDDDFSLQVANLCRQAGSFEINGQNSLELHIKGWGIIKLERIE